MNNIYHISKKNILEKVLLKIEDAKKNIFVTNFDANEEIPAKFLNLIEQKKEEGILFQRISFRRKQHESDILIENPQEYQRMILIDEEKLFWGTDKNNLQLFFYTENSEIVSKFLEYFQKTRQS